MQSVQVGELKKNFSSVLKKIENDGEEYVVEYGKAHKKIAVIIPYDNYMKSRKKRKFGLLKGKASCTITDEFALTDDEFLLS